MFALNHINGFGVGVDELVLVSQIANNNGSGTDAAPTITLPSGIVAGNLLVASIGCNGNNTWTWPAGWSELSDSGSLSVAYRVADGTETTVAPTQNGTSTTAWVAFNIRGQAATSYIEAGTTATGSSTAPNPPSLTPTWSNTPTLFIAVVRSKSTSVTGYPSGYSNTQTSSGSTVSHSSATKTIPGAAEDPGTFTTGNDNWSAQTVAIRGK